MWLYFYRSIIAIDRKNHGVHRLLSILVYDFLLVCIFNVRLTLSLVSMYAIETQQLTYCFPQHFTERFGGAAEKTPVLHDIDLQVPVGSIYGFLGQNGAGKTTTLRLILGLLKKQQGRIAVLGKEFEDDRIGILRKIGSLIESPSLYSHLTARENLRIIQKVHGVSVGRIDEVLEFVGLADTGSKKTGQFSLGMKQRLGIAIALMNHPSLLILDEPTNGLDPRGIIEIREMLKTLNREHGTTILISSHLLAEIEKLVSHVGIIHGGTLIFQGTLESLLFEREAHSRILLTTSDIHATLGVLASFGLHGTVEHGCVILPTLPNDMIAQLVSALVHAHIAIYGVVRHSDDLEAIFMKAIQ